VFLCGRLFVSECLCFGLAAWGAGVLSPFVSVSTTGVYFFLSLSLYFLPLSQPPNMRDTRDKLVSCAVLPYC
jgi:hypothetical protein